MSTQSGAIAEDKLYHIKPVVRKKPDTFIIYASTNDLTNGVATLNKVKKLVLYVKEIDNGKHFQIIFPVSFVVQIKTLKKKSTKLTPD